MIDTLRADHLGIYGYKRNTSPAIDQFGKDNVYATRAIAVAPWTPPSVTSILTGLSVARHGHNPHLQEAQSRKLGQVLSEEIDTIAEILKRQGYQTAASSSNPWITKEFNFDQGFDSFFYQRRSTTEVSLNAARKFVEQLKHDPFFLYIHILDPHGPRTPSPEYAALFQGKVEGAFPYSDIIQHKVNLYDAEIRSVDDQLSEFFSFLKQNGLYDDAVIVIVSDHGEQFEEHGDLGHGKMLHLEEVHIPFLLKCDNQKQEITAITSNLDVTPTILDCLKMKVHNKFDGLSILNSEALIQRAGAYSSVTRTYLQEAYTSGDGLRIINHKGRADNPTKDWELKGVYDMEQDPFEINPIFDPQLAAELNGYLSSIKAKQAPDKNLNVDNKEVSAEALEQLESLGYINE